MMAQIFVTDFGWSQSYPMACKRKAHDVLGLLFVWEGAPPMMITDSTKEMKLGAFARKSKRPYATCISPTPTVRGQTLPSMR